MSTGTASMLRFAAAAAVMGVLVFMAARATGSNYGLFAGYVVLQYVVLSTAWNILGSCGYVNLGSAAFFAIGAYASVALNRLMPLPLPVLIGLAGVLCLGVGVGVGYLTLRLRGVYFSIATLALSVVAQTFVTNWDFVGGSRGAYTIRPPQGPLGGSYIQYLFATMLVLAIVSVVAARTIERSWLGYGLSAVRDDEHAAEACGVPTLRLKLIATGVSGMLMGMAGAPLPFYVTYLDPSSTFNLAYTVNSIAMPIIGGMTSWVGPVIGAILLSSVQQVATVTISSSVNLLIVGVLLVVFVVAAPNGLLGLFKRAPRPMATVPAAAQ